jgi:hypothetical protein
MEKKDLTREMLSEKGMLDVSKYSQQDKKFYSSQKWQRERKKYKELHPFCEVCLKENIQKPSEIVHHITPISQGGEPYDEKNLLAICKKCHSEIHTGISIKIDKDYVLNFLQFLSTPAGEWWSSGLYDFYRGKEKTIEDMIKKAQILERKDVEKSIDLYFKAIRLIDDYEKIGNSGLKTSQNHRLKTSQPLR